MLSFNLVILGPQGSGKGTQTELLSKRFRMPYLGAGELIRKKAQEDTEEGRKIKTLHNAGLLIENSLVKNLFEKELSKIPKEQTVIFEGYPRNLEQIKDFEEILKKRTKRDKRVIILKIKDETVYKRLSGRRYCPFCEKNYYPPESLRLKKCPVCNKEIIKRPDDSEKAIKKRLNIYKKETKPVISYFKKRSELISVNGEASIGEVNKAIIRKLGRSKFD